MSEANLALNLTKYEKALAQATITQDIGKITQVTGFLLKGFIPGACMGSICDVYPMAGETPFLTEVIGFKDRHVLLMPLGEMRGVGLGSKIVLKKSQATVFVGNELLGRVVDGLGRPIDGRGPLDTLEEIFKKEI